MRKTALGSSLRSLVLGLLLTSGVLACSGVQKEGEETLGGTFSLSDRPLGVFDPTRTPAQTVPADRWGLLEPVHLTDNCATCVIEDWTSHQGDVSDTTVFFHDLDVEGNVLFTATGRGLKLYDITNPTAPAPFRYVNANGKDSAGNDIVPLFSPSDKNFYITSISVPDGDSNLTVTGAEDFGLIVWDTTLKNNVDVHYQDSGVFVRNVHTARIDSRAFAFAVDGKDLRLYDMTAASSLSRCHEQTQSCPGVLKGVLASGGSNNAFVSGTGSYVFYRNLLNLRIFDVGNVASFPVARPAVKLEGDLVGVSAVGEAELWEDGGKLYLALPVGNPAREGELWIYDVSCIASPGGCGGLPSPVVYSTPDASFDVVPLMVDVSFDDGGRPYLYVGTTAIARALNPVCVPQREYFFDAGNPASLVELTPKVHPEGYWGWYYEPCFGYNSMAPRHARMKGDVLYRTAFSFLDSHQVSTTLIFRDGFESGTTQAWSATVP